MPTNEKDRNNPKHLTSNGEPCEWCGGRWEEVRGLTNMELIHKDNCEYLMVHKAKDVSALREKRGEFSILTRTIKVYGKTKWTDAQWATLGERLAEVIEPALEKVASEVEERFMYAVERSDDDTAVRTEWS